MQREQILRFERARALLADKHGRWGGTHVARVAGRDQVLVESVRVCKGSIAGGAGELRSANDWTGSLVVACWSADDGFRWWVLAGRGVGARSCEWCGTRGIRGVHNQEVLI